MEHIDIKIYRVKKSGCSIATVSRVINRSKTSQRGVTEKSNRYDQKV